MNDGLVENFLDEDLTSYGSIRQHSRALVQNLTEADCQIQSMPDASPPNGIWRIRLGSLKHLS